MLLPKLADMTTALTAKCVGTAQSLPGRLQAERPTEGAQELEIAVHAMQAGVSRLMWMIDKRATPERCTQSFEDLVALTNDAWSACGAMLTTESEVAAGARKVAVEVTLETTVTQRRLERAEQLAETIRQDLEKRRSGASSVRQALLQRLSEREAAESQQLRDARRLHRQAEAIVQAFGQLTEARTRLCGLVQQVRFAAIALQDGLHPVVRSEQALQNRAALEPLRQLGEHLRFTLIQAGAELVRMQMHETVVRNGLVAMRQVRAA